MFTTSQSCNMPWNGCWSRPPLPRPSPLAARGAAAQEVGTVSLRSPYPRGRSLDGVLFRSHRDETQFCLQGSGSWPGDEFLPAP